MFDYLFVDATNRARAIFHAVGLDRDLFMRDILKAKLATGKPQVILCWDHPEGSAQRRKILSEYKSHRPQDKEANEAEIEFLLTAKEKYCCWYDSNYEADDLIATGVRAMSAAGTLVAIYSADKDLHSLLQYPNTMQMWKSSNKFDRNSSRYVYMTLDTFYAKYQLRPEQWVDYRAMVGDPSDGLIGIKGIGQSSAKKLFERFNTVEEAVFDESGLGWPKKRHQLLVEAFNNGDFQRTREVLKLNFNCPVPTNVREAIQAGSQYPKDLIAMRVAELEESLK